MNMSKENKLNREQVLHLLRNAIEACSTAMLALEIVKDNFPEDVEKTVRAKYNLSDSERQRRVEHGRTISKGRRKNLPELVSDAAVGPHVSLTRVED